MSDVNPLTTVFLSMSKNGSINRSYIKTTRNVKFVFHREENIVRIGENVGCKYCSLFLQCFLKAFSLRGVESGHCVGKGLIFFSSL